MNLLTAMEIPEDLIKQMSRGKCVLFIGSGISAGAGLPKWSDFLFSMLKHCEKNQIILPNSLEIKEEIKNESYLTAADHIRECMDKYDTLQFHRFISEEIQVDKIAPTVVHETITKLPISIILTTNYDELIERAYNKYTDLYFRRHSLFAGEPVLIQENIQQGKKVILHVHGTADVPNTIILGTKDYEKAKEYEACNRILQEFISNNTILFIGFSLNDPNILFQMDKLKELFGQAPGRHYALMSSRSANKWMNRNSNGFEKISIIPYEGDAQESINEFLNELLKQVKKYCEETGIVLEDKSGVRELNTTYGDSRFYSVGRFEPKTPKELLKQSLNEDVTSKESELLQLMADIAGKSTFKEQINRALNDGYADMYSNSWLDRESQIIGLHLLYKLFKNLRKEMQEENFVLSNMYDAGCSNCGQYKALLAFKEWDTIPLSDNFKYYAQDFNPDWYKSVPKQNGIFYQMSLPHFEKSLEGKCNLVCCTQALHYLGKNPLAIYSSFFSFNRLLHSNGYCYITVPEKTSLPGMPDLMDKAARSAGFEIKYKGKKRLVQKLGEKPHNITTFYYLILKKKQDIEPPVSDYLIHLSLLRGHDFENARKYKIIENESTREIRSPAFEDNLNSIINTDNLSVRIFRYALEVVRYEGVKELKSLSEWEKIKSMGELSIDKWGVDEWKKIINECVESIQCLIMSRGSSRTYSVERKYKLQGACSEYLRWLLRYLIITDSNDSYKVKNVIEYLNSTTESLKDIRVNISRLDWKQIARLTKHLFELCLYEDIDVLRNFEGVRNIECED